MSPELLFDVLRVSSTIACIILAAYLIRCSDILNKLDLNNNLVVHLHLSHWPTHL